MGVGGGVSTPSSLGQRGIPSSLGQGIPHPVLNLGWGTPQTWDGYPHSAGWGTLPLGSGMGTPHLDLGWGTSPSAGWGTPHLDLGWGIPAWTWDGVPAHLDQGWGNPPPPVSWMGYPPQPMVNRQTFPSINIALPRTTYAGGKKIIERRNFIPCQEKFTFSKNKTSKVLPP